MIKRFPKDILKKAIFVGRINTFLEVARIGNIKEEIHIHDPGGILLLKPNTRIIIVRSKSPKRRTRYDLLAFSHNDEWVFSNSKYHSEIFEITMRKGLTVFKGEIRKEVEIYGSRIDFLINSTAVEVKGCTWIRNMCCYFPDAPTERGRCHISSLIKHKNHECGDAYVVFLVFHRNAECLRIARGVDPLLYNEAVKAYSFGVKFLAYKYGFDGSILYFIDKIPAYLD